MTTLTLDLLLEASAPGGSSCMTSTTELEPAAGQQATVAPAKFALRGRDGGAYAYEIRYLDGQPAQAVLIDSKQSQLNRAEAALCQAIDEGHPVLSRLPRVEVVYDRDGRRETYSDLTLPHRVFDGHVRAGSVEGVPVSQLAGYRAVRDSTPADARALLDMSPISLVFGGWDSTRASHQGRWRSVLTGEVIGFCVSDEPATKGGARIDPVGMRIQLDEATLKQLVADQGAELSEKTSKALLAEAAKAKAGKSVKSSIAGLGGIPPTLEALAGVACRRIVRAHVFSFAALRQIRFGAGAEGDAACRALLAALALSGLARADAELVLRANCDLREVGPSSVEMDQRGGRSMHLDPLTITGTDQLLQDALAHAEKSAGVVWRGVSLRVTGNPAVVAGAADEEQAEGN